MSYLVTVPSLITSIRQDCDFEGDAFVTDAEITRKIKQSTAAMYDLIEETHGPDNLRQTISYTSDGSNNVVTLPPTFGVLLLVMINTTITGMWSKLFPMTAADLPMMKNIALNPGSSLPTRYRLGRPNLTNATVLDGGNATLEIWPKPMTAYTLTVEYVPGVTFTATNKIGRAHV